MTSLSPPAQRPGLPVGNGRPRWRRPVLSVLVAAVVGILATP